MGSRSLADSHSLCNRLIVAARLTPVDPTFLLVSRPISTRAAAAVIEWSAGLFHGRGFAWKQFLQMDSAGNSRSPDRAEITDSSSHGGASHLITTSHRAEMKPQAQGQERTKRTPASSAAFPHVPCSMNGSFYLQDSYDKLLFVDTRRRRAKVERIRDRCGELTFLQGRLGGGQAVDAGIHDPIWEHKRKGPNSESVNGLHYRVSWHQDNYIETSSFCEARRSPRSIPTGHLLHPGAASWSRMCSQRHLSLRLESYNK